MSIFIGICILFVLYRFFLRTSTSTSTSIETTDTVQRGDIEQSIKIVGESELIDEQQLRFNQWGDIVSVYVKEWDIVSKGDHIAQLDDIEAQNNIIKAEINLENAQIQLQEVLDGNTELQKLQAESDAANAQMKYNLAQSELKKLTQDQEFALRQQKQNIAFKKQEIEQTKQSLDILAQEVALYKKQAGNDITTSTVTNNKVFDDAMTNTKKYIMDGDYFLDQIDYIFGISDLNEW